MSFGDYKKEVYDCSECRQTVENPKENEDKVEKPYTVKEGEKMYK